MMCDRKIAKEAYFKPSVFFKRRVINYFKSISWRSCQLKLHYWDIGYLEHCNFQNMLIGKANLTKFFRGFNNLMNNPIKKELLPMNRCFLTSIRAFVLIVVINVILPWTLNQMSKSLGWYEDDRKGYFFWQI